MCTKVYEKVVLDTTSVCDIVFMRPQHVNETGAFLDGTAGQYVNETTGNITCTNVHRELQLNKVYERVSASEDYFKRAMLGMDEETTWENMGGIKWELVLCLAAAWIIVCLCLIKGVQSSGKVVYFTALFPYLVLTILLIFGCTLEGAYEGILFYVYPTAEKLEGLKGIAVWSAAATQIFYSL